MKAGSPGSALKFDAGIVAGRVTAYAAREIKERTTKGYA